MGPSCACLCLNVTLYPACTLRPGAYSFKVFEMIGATAMSWSQSTAVHCGVKRRVDGEDEGVAGTALTVAAAVWRQE